MAVADLGGCSFSKNLAISYVGVPQPPRRLAPLLREYWIRPCMSRRTDQKQWSELVNNVKSYTAHSIH